MKTIACAIGFAAALATPAPAAVGAPLRAPETCHGLPVTITGTPGSVIDGTPGNDVIATDGARGVHAAEGDDTICVTGPDGFLGVDAGGGADFVDLTGLVVTAPAAGSGQVSPVHTIGLGDGADTVVGSAGSEYVALNGSGPDAVALGDGADAVAAGADLLDDGSSIDLGGGDDGFRVFDGIYNSLDFPSTPADTAPVTGGGPLQLDGGAGNNSMELDGPHRYAINAKRQIATMGDQRITYRHVDSYKVYARGSKARAFIGSNRPEDFAYVGGRVGSVAMGGGSDTVTILTPDRQANHAASIDGGPGVNTLEVQQLEHRATSVVDLAAGTFTNRQGVIAQFRQFRNATAVGVERLIGTNGPNTLRWNVCSPVTINAAGGADVLRPAPDTAAGGCGEPATLRGGGGADRITGGPVDDFINGGVGRDRADGADGRDRCVSIERARDCEKR